MSPLSAFVLLLVVGGLALATDQVVLFQLTDVLLVALLMAWLWSWLSLRGLRLKRELSQNRTQAGGTLDQRLILTSHFPFPRLWIELIDGGTLPAYHPGRVFDLGVGGRRVWRLDVLCQRRGAYQLGPAWVGSSDPFGFFRIHRTIGDCQDVLVYPRTVDLEGLSLPAGHLLGGARRRTGWHQTTPHVAGVREYHPGDALKQIHWPSTAHTGRLMVKEFDLDPVADVWIFLDLEEAVQRGVDDESTEEYAIIVAASLCRHFLTQGRSVGLAAHGWEHLIVPADRGQRQMLKVFESLAIAEAEGNQPIAAVIAVEGGRCKRSAAAIVVTPSLDERWPAMLRALKDRGVAIGAVALEASTFGTAESSLLIVGALSAAEVPNILIKRGEDLSAVLTAGWR